MKTYRTNKKKRNAKRGKLNLEVYLLGGSSTRITVNEYEWNNSSDGMKSEMIDKILGQNNWTIALTRKQDPAGATTSTTIDFPA